MKAKKVFFGIGAVVLAGGILAGCSDSVEDVSSSKPAKQEAKKESTQDAKDKTYNVGDTVKVNGLSVTITKASYTPAQEYTPAEKGKVLTLEVATENGGDDSAFIDNTEFNIYDKGGNQLEQYFGYDDLAISGDVNKGKKLSGKLYFDVPEAESYELIYKPTFAVDNTEIKFNIKPQ
ncbi:DUF4352 domain-containing protein [Priestia aryabhattai]|uniref:DUF4352 domain-containing protein n=1 Tax=Priestia aryabhattai TaxID=412384 RepID=UPI0020421102|nr:DUF4352 domain-containing protein [Priestia aryabhattai]MCM3639657.1 DUF4352 domain-containing protein [Priestia aryabhattai]